VLSWLVGQAQRVTQLGSPSIGDRVLEPHHGVRSRGVATPHPSPPPFCEKRLLLTFNGEQAPSLHCTLRRSTTLVSACCAPSPSPSPSCLSFNETVHAVGLGWLQGLSHQKCVYLGCALCLWSSRPTWLPAGAPGASNKRDSTHPKPKLAMAPVAPCLPSIRACRISGWPRRRSRTCAACRSCRRSRRTCRPPRAQP